MPCGVYELFFFFFQAEDGIRDIGVTGVQTCALPIYVLAADLAEFVTFTGVGDKFRKIGGQYIAQLNPNGSPGNQFSAAAWGLMPSRSEERRVGKECRSRWSPYH